nr:DNA-directed RNA polymerase III subunit RPC1-like [Cherax quadricarinatus]
MEEHCRSIGPYKAGPYQNDLYPKLPKNLLPYPMTQIKLSSSNSYLSNLFLKLPKVLASITLLLKEMDVCVESKTIITVRPSKTKTSSMYYQLQYLKQSITKVVIKGFPSVNRAVINQVIGWSTATTRDGYYRPLQVSVNVKPL